MQYEGENSPFTALKCPAWRPRFIIDTYSLANGGISLKHFLGFLISGASHLKRVLKRASAGVRRFCAACTGCTTSRYGGPDACVTLSLVSSMC